jgi:hypothetical protein
MTTPDQIYLTAEQVLAEVDDFCEKNGNPEVAKAMRHAYLRDGKMPAAVLSQLKLKPETLWRRV